MSNAGFGGQDTSNVEKIKLYTGVGEFQVIAINPSKEELKKLLNKDNIEKEPSYKVVFNKDTENEIEKSKLVFWVKGLGVYTTDKLTADGNKLQENWKCISKIEFIISDNNAKESSKGTKQFINDYGLSTYSKDIETLTSSVNSNEKSIFKLEGVRLAKDNEVLVVNFMKKWLSVSKDNKASFKNWSNLVKGDVSEIRQYIKQFTNNKLKLLMCVEENGGKTYQKIYPYSFDYITSSNFKNFENDIKGYFPKNLDFQNSFNIQEFVPDYKSNNNNNSFSNSDNNKSNDEETYF